MNKIILIAGGSASGKTYVANSVLNTLKSEDIIRLTIDDFYKDNSLLPLEERRKINFDHPKSIDFKVLNDVLVARYKQLGGNFISKLNRHREKQYFLASSEGFNFISKEYADEQINIL